MKLRFYYVVQIDTYEDLFETLEEAENQALIWANDRDLSGTAVIYKAFKGVNSNKEFEDVEHSTTVRNIMWEIE